MRDNEAALERLGVALERVDWIVRDFKVWEKLGFEDDWRPHILSALTGAESWTSMAEGVL